MHIRGGEQEWSTQFTEIGHDVRHSNDEQSLTFVDNLTTGVIMETFSTADERGTLRGSSSSSCETRWRVLSQPGLSGKFSRPRFWSLLTARAIGANPTSLD